MKTVTPRMAALGALAAILAALPPAFAEAAQFKGMIVSHEGSTLVIHGPAGDTRVALTDATKVRSGTGGLGIRSQAHPTSDLIRGLAVEVTAADVGGQLFASEVTFKTSDLKTARQIAAGIRVTEGQVSENTTGVSENAARIAENAARIDNVGLLEPAGRTKVFFPVGSAVISEAGKRDLQAIATEAKAMKQAYRLAVVGRADPSGNAAANQRLSEARAAAVTAYLIQSAGISPAQFLPSSGLGSSPIAEDIDPPRNAQEARRVTVTIAVSKSAQR